MKGVASEEPSCCPSRKASNSPCSWRPKSGSVGSVSGSVGGVPMGAIQLMRCSSFWASSKSICFFWISSSFRSSSSWDRVVSKLISRSPFFTCWSCFTKILETVWVSDRNTV